MPGSDRAAPSSEKSSAPLTASTAPQAPATAAQAHAASPESREPPLIFLCVAAAVCASAIQQTAMPLLVGSEYRTALPSLELAGSFAANLAAIAGIIALAFTLLSFARQATWMGLSRRFFVAGLSGVFLSSMSIAVLFDRQRTTTEGVFFAFCAASVLTSLLHGVAFRVAQGINRHLLAISATVMAAAALTTQLLQLWSQTTLSAWHLSVLNVARTSGELAYLAILVTGAVLVLPTRELRGRRIARAIAFFAAPLCAGALIAVERALGKDYSLVLYQNQRVSLWLDTLPSAYALPLAFALTSALAGLAANDTDRRQGACGLLLLLASGYAPPAPGRLLTLTLGLTLLARAVIALSVSKSAPKPPATAASSTAAVTASPTDTSAVAPTT